MMKNNKLGIWAIGIVMGLVFTTACDPQYTAPVSFDAPDSTLVDFTITQGATAFDVILQNTSQIEGLVKWDLGNGTFTEGEMVETKYRLSGNYTIKLTVFTRGGSATKTKVFEQTQTDFSIFSDPVFINLSGGVDAVSGKTWVLDSLRKGHIGVGPSDPAGNGMEWWAAAPMGKAGAFMYDDEINFNINKFVATLTNNGVSYVKGYRTSDPAYSNPRQNDGDFNVDFTPVPGTWSVEQKDGASYLTLNATKPLFPIFDVGAKNNEYKIVNIDENSLELVCFTNDEPWTLWHYYLIRKGFVKPTISFNAAAAATANANEYSFTVADLVIPEGLSVPEVTWKFADKTADALITDASEAVLHTFMKAGTYTVTAELKDNNGDVYSKTIDVTVAANHPDYLPYIEDNMTLYNNFESIFYKLLVDQAGGTASFAMIANPSKADPNESNFCVDFTKVNTQWANLNMPLSSGFRFDLTQSSKFKLLVYGAAGTKVLLKMENMDLGGNAWQTGVELTYTIKQSNTWEMAEYDFNGIANAGVADPIVTDVVADPRTNTGYYNVMRIMINAGDGSATYNVLIDDIAGPTVVGLK